VFSLYARVDFVGMPALVAVGTWFVLLNTRVASRRYTGEASPHVMATTMADYYTNIPAIASTNWLA